MNFQLRRSFCLRVSFRIEITHVHNVLESLRAHRARVHAQRATDCAGDSFHPFKIAETRRSRCVSDLFQFHAGARCDFAPINVDLVEIAAGRMNDHTADAAIAHEKIRAAADDEKWKILAMTKTNQLGEGRLRARFDPKFRRAADPQGRVLRKWLVKANIAFFADDRF